MNTSNKINTALKNPNLSKTMRNYLTSVRNKTVKNSEAKKLINNERKRQTQAENNARIQRLLNFVAKEKKLYNLQPGNLITYNNEGIKKNGIVLQNYKNTSKRHRIPGAIIRLNPNTNQQNTFVVKSKNMNFLTKRNKGGKRRNRRTRRY